MTRSKEKDEKKEAPGRLSGEELVASIWEGKHSKTVPPSYGTDPYIEKDGDTFYDADWYNVPNKIPVFTSTYHSLVSSVISATSVAIPMNGIAGMDENPEFKNEASPKVKKIVKSMKKYKDFV